MGAGVKPGETPGEGLDFQFAVFQEFLVYCCNLQFASCGGLYAVGHLDYLVGIEVEAYHCIVAFGVLGLLLDGEAVSFPVEFGYSISLRVIDPVSKYSGFVLLLRCPYCFAEDFGEACSVEDVVSEDKAGGVIADEVLADYEGLGESVGGRLLSVG